MQAFIPQKDTALLLAQAARSFITEYNRRILNGGGADAPGATGAASVQGGGTRYRGTGGFLIPRFPLYAMGEGLSSLRAGDSAVTGCLIAAPQGEEGGFYFPVELTLRTGEESLSEHLRLKIVFATFYASGGKETGQPPSAQELPDGWEYNEKFPLHPRVFRTGRIEFYENSWEVWEEKWHKLARD